MRSRIPSKRRRWAAGGQVMSAFVGSTSRLWRTAGDGVERSLIQHGAARVRGAADQIALVRGVMSASSVSASSLKPFFAQRIGNRLGLRDMWVGKIDR